jgi:outer membrane protein insertion porin family
MKQLLRFLAVAILIATAAVRVAYAQEQKLIEAVKVVGNDSIPQEGILDEVKQILRPGDPYTPDKAKAAQTAVAAMGYFDDVQVTTEEKPTGITVTIRVVEKQRIQKIVFVGNTVVDDTALADIIFTRVGHVVDDRVIRRDVRRIEDFYAQRGYIAHVSKASVGQFGVLTFVIEEARVEDVLIEGLKHTDVVVVRRELTIKPGELFQEKKIASDIQRIFNLGLFKNATSDIRPGVKDPQRGVIVVITIEEKRTGSASVAAGYSSLDKFVLVLSLSENNFRGRGERASVNMELFGRTSYDFSFFEPYIDAKGSSFQVQVYDTESRRRFVGGPSVATTDQTFDERRSGGTFSLSKPIGPRTRASLAFRSEKVSSSSLQSTRFLPNPHTGGLQPQATFQDLTNPGPRPPDNTNLDPDVPEPGDSLGPVVVAAPLHPGGRLVTFTFGWTQDSRNLIANPSHGAYTGLTVEQSGTFFGGASDFTKIQLDQRFFRPWLTKEGVLAVRAMDGASFGDLPLFESYSVGGTNNLRGYEEDRFRGENMAVLNVEYRHAITDKLTGVAFVDVGDAFGGTFPTVVPGFNIPAEDESFKAHVGAGLGMRVVTPIGPIRLDFGWGSDGSRAHFSFGQTF